MSEVGRPIRLETIHPPSVVEHPLPLTVSSRDQLPDDRGWWGFSFRDVPERRSDATLLVTLHDARIVSYRDPDRHDDFFPAIVTGGTHGLDLREIRYRPRHAEAMRSPSEVHLDRATWIIERVYHNHSHWLTAHLPKLLLLRELGRLDEVILPAERTAAMDGSLRLIGLDPERFLQIDLSRPIQVDELTVLSTDRFRPELLRLVQDACGPGSDLQPWRRVYISRDRASRRRLRNEEELWPLLEANGFERVHMEELSFEAQVGLMRETSVLVAPHGAGLTNMVFCAPGTRIVEIADLSFPNPNFYALSSALGHQYRLVAATGVGDAHPLERDMAVDLPVIRPLLARL